MAVSIKMAEEALSNGKALLLIDFNIKCDTGFRILKAGEHGEIEQLTINPMGTYTPLSKYKELLNRFNVSVSTLSNEQELTGIFRNYFMLTTNQKIVDRMVLSTSEGIDVFQEVKVCKDGYLRPEVVNALQDLINIASEEGVSIDSESENTLFYINDEKYDIQSFIEMEKNDDSYSVVYTQMNEGILFGRRKVENVQIDLKKGLISLNDKFGNEIADEDKINKIKSINVVLSAQKEAILSSKIGIDRSFNYLLGYCINNGSNELIEKLDINPNLIKNSFMNLKHSIDDNKDIVRAFMEVKFKDCSNSIDYVTRIKEDNNLEIVKDMVKLNINGYIEQSSIIEICNLLEDIPFLSESGLENNEYEIALLRDSIDYYKGVLKEFPLIISKMQKIELNECGDFNKEDIEYMEKVIKILHL